MSDPEAGECEGPENPQPEDEAHLTAAFTAQVSADPTPPSQPDQPSQPQACAGDTGDTTSASAEDGDDDANHSEHLPPEASHGDGDDWVEPRAVEGTGDCDQGGTEERGEVEGQQAWPPESDRASDGCREGGVSGASSGENADVDRNAASSMCEGEGGGDVRQSDDSAVVEQSTMNGELSQVSSSDHCDQESPPEDELFPARPSCAGEEDTASVDVAAGDSNTGNTCSVWDHSSTSQSTADTTNATDPQQGSLAQSPPSAPSPAQVGSELSASGAEKEDDQVPECDRESLPQSSPQASAHASHPGSCEEVRPDQAHSSEVSSSDSSVLHATDGESTSHGESGTHTANSKDLTAATADCGDSSPPPGQSGSQAASPDSRVNRPDVCDNNSSDCDTTAAVSQPSSISSTQHRPSPPVSRDRPVLREPYFLDEDSEEEELLTELDAELQLRCSPQRQQRRASGSGGGVRLSINGLRDVDVNSSELCKQFEEQLLQLQETVLQRDREISRLKAQKDRQREVSQEVIAERDKLRAELTGLRDNNPDDLYLPQIKELEYTISQQQGEVRQLKEKLTTHDGAAKRAIATLQSEMKARIDQITKLYEDSCREKDSMVVKFAQAETKNIEVKCAQEKMEARVRDLLKEKEFTNNKMRAAMAEKQKAVADLKAKMGEMGVLQKEVEKVKEEMSSADYRIKWHQNKLKAELEGHKETKVSLEKTTAKLKEAKEETEMIRKDCQAIVKTYQESEEVRSNSLDKELRMKETELMIKMKEHSDTAEIHLKTKQELDVLKAHHKDAMEELKTLKDKVQCLEEERLQGEQVQAQYQNIIQSQKTDNTSLSKQLTTLQTLQEDFDRAQEMIKSLDGEVSGLKLANRDLQKDTESCQARESKMLTLQSELSRTNALLRSENTSLHNQVATLSGEVQKLSMDIQDLETRCRNMADQLEEEHKKRQEETNSLSTQLAAKSKESEDYKQKWEDEIDASKTWKRKHTSNVKDLTRQLQQAKKRLEQSESGGGAGGERDATSMGSRTNSNGSLNSMDNSSNHHPPHHATAAPHHNAHPPPNPPSRPASQEPEFPVIKEQVEVDRQLLIERIVKLQRSLARKNEKLDFVEEHIQQLVLEIKKKNRIIQGYVMREEAGTLASDVMDANKALLARKGGIMASVYSHHQQDGAMTLDLSLQINQKLQAVLEDTLLKNITLKENLDTLGAEIARLSQENRRLQLHIQGLDSH